VGSSPAQVERRAAAIVVTGPFLSTFPHITLTVSLKENKMRLNSRKIERERERARESEGARLSGSKFCEGRVAMQLRNANNIYIKTENANPNHQTLSAQEQKCMESAMCKFGNSAKYYLLSNLLGQNKCRNCVTDTHDARHNDVLCSNLFLFDKRYV
jgi:hypothetical protein